MNMIREQIERFNRLQRNNPVSGKLLESRILNLIDILERKCQMEIDDLKWNSVDSLPIEEEQNKKVLLLTEGRLSGSTTLHIVTDYWNVFHDNRELQLNNVFDKIKRLSENCISYGRFGERKVPLNKIKGWMYADDLINLYNGRK